MSEARMTIENIDALDCTGCGCCIGICPKSAISFEYTNEGFFYPQIDKDHCINCGKCYNHCPVNTPIKKHTNGAVRVIQLKDEEHMLDSASGGGFYGLAVHVLSKGGIICGCVLDERMLPKHILTDEINDLYRMQGSKYVQSRVDVEVYRSVRDELDNKRLVLFSGTPCQIAGLKSYLERDYDNLITIGLICHGVAGPGLFLHYISVKRKELGGKIKDVRFRSRTVGHYPENHSIRIITDCAEYDRQAFNEPYGANFYHNRILRESCYRCQYATRDRVEDITLGDYNDALTKGLKLPSDNGFNILILNSDKGSRLFEEASELFYQSEINEEYEQINLIQPTLRPSCRDRLRKAHVDMANPENDPGYFIKTTAMDRIKGLIPAKMKDKIKILIGRGRR